ncbi:hypothetical protein CYG68_19255 [Morganella morganii]|uniref:ProQ/FinO domain-containing protein n=1 Tax=Morganella morganii TaxID=582 RepID=A0A8I0PZD8_MORMO|nr:hypothetical protein [Morganella morganii]
MTTAADSQAQYHIKYSARTFPHPEETAAISAESGTASVRTLTRCLSSVSNAAGYRLTVIAGAARYDKDRQPGETVTPEEDADSVKRLEKLRKRQAKGKAE